MTKPTKPTPTTPPASSPGVRAPRHERYHQAHRHGYSYRCQTFHCAQIFLEDEAAEIELDEQGTAALSNRRATTDSCSAGEMARDLSAWIPVGGLRSAARATKSKLTEGLIASSPLSESVHIQTLGEDGGCETSKVRSEDGVQEGRRAQLRRTCLYLILSFLVDLALKSLGPPHGVIMSLPRRSARTASSPC